MGGMPPGAPPMGMADGGLAALPVPESMFDEPMDGGYANGGIVSFATGDEVDYNKILQKQMAYFQDPEKLKADYFMGGQPKREASDRFRQFYADALSEEGQKKRRDEDKYFALAQLGATMASTPGSLLQAASAGINKALPGLQESSKERRAEQREAIKQLALDEGASNAEARDIGKMVMDGRLKATDIGQTIAQIRSREDLTRAEIKSREKISGAEIAAQRAIAGMKQPNESFDETALRILMMDPKKPGVAAAQEAVGNIYNMKKTATTVFAPGLEGEGGGGGGGGGARKPVVTVSWNPT
jgi:hypothetical protein